MGRLRLALAGLLAYPPIRSAAHCYALHTPCGATRSVQRGSGYTLGMEGIGAIAVRGMHVACDSTPWGAVE